MHVLVHVVRCALALIHEFATKAPLGVVFDLVLLFGQHVCDAVMIRE